MPHDPWKGVTVKSLFPDLDPDDPESMISGAKEQVESLRDNVDQKWAGVNKRMNDVTNMLNWVTAVKNQVDEVFDRVEGVIDAISNTGAHATIVTSAEGQPGENNFISEISNAIKDSADPNSPDISETSYAASILIVVSKPSLGEAQSAISDFNDVIKGL